MERLHFGSKARRKQRLKRLALWAWILSTTAMLAGIPGASSGVDLLDRIVGRAALLERTRDDVGTSASAASIVRFRRGLFLQRPGPTPSAAFAPATSVTDVIAAAASEFGLSPDYLISVAYCESTLNPGAVNAAGYYGLFQFDSTTWASYGYGSIYDPVAQARTAARLIAAGQASRWPNCA